MPFVKMRVQIRYDWGFPGGPLVKNPPWNAEGMGSIFGWETKIPYALWRGQKKKKKTAQEKELIEKPSSLKTEPEARFK